MLVNHTQKSFMPKLTLAIILGFNELELNHKKEEK
jgi:hypothetical protein